MSALVTLAGDGTWRIPTDERARDLDENTLRLEALTRLRGLLGDDLEDQIATRLFLPTVLGTGGGGGVPEAARHMLPQSLALLAGTTGDLTSYGWRIGPGAGRAWRVAGELHARVLEAARIALLGYEGPLQVSALGPLTLAASTFLASGERTLSDRGALRDLPHLLAEGLAGEVAAVRSHVPGADVHLHLDDSAAMPVLAGRIPTPSGYRRYPALPAPEIGGLWQVLLEALGESADLDPGRITLAPGTEPSLLGAARTAGARHLAFSPAALPVIGGQGTRGAGHGTGRRTWEDLAEAREAGLELDLVLDPRRAEPVLEAVAHSWRELGYGPRELAGFTLMAHRPASARSATADPAAEGAHDDLLGEDDLRALMRVAPSWAERIER
ncbi:hypothetical protein DEO23_12575 [Brachybacterium endophyticum]|uniref:Methionine synthase n=1 Tax=Brachybacterium endophyticum TaxID=2182385 RepID=A0A2U2RHQ9_9MICO|nr:hypothetical protein [Brachybacterium endophyticum]PWH05412.1 hypothetical protein DEO23_12575 [Brachybacterium endophyticum]